MQHKTLETVQKSGEKRSTRKGFSLLEVLIAMFIFVTIIMVSVSVFARLYKLSRETRILQQTMENGGTAIELMAKNIRMSSKVELYGGSNKRIRMFNNSQGKCIAYVFVSGALRTATYDPLPPFDPTSPDCSNVGTLVDMLSGNIDGYFIVVPTDASGGPGNQTIGRATIYVINNPFDIPGRFTVSFRDYSGIIQ